MMLCAVFFWVSLSMTWFLLKQFRFSRIVIQKYTLQPHLPGKFTMANDPVQGRCSELARYCIASIKFRYGQGIC